MYAFWVRCNIHKYVRCLLLLLLFLRAWVQPTPPPLPSNRPHRSNGDCLEGKSLEGKLSGLFCAILCATIVHSAMHIHMNRPNSSLDWVLSHWAHFTVRRFVFVHVLLLALCSIVTR